MRGLGAIKNQEGGGVEGDEGGRCRGEGNEDGV